MKSIPVETRRLIVDAVKSGESMAHIASIFQVCYSTVRNYVRLDANDSLEPKKRTGRIELKISPAILEKIKTWIKEKNDLTLKQIQRKIFEQFQVEAAIWYRLTAMNITWKKNDIRKRKRAG